MCGVEHDAARARPNASECARACRCAGACWTLAWKGTAAVIQYEGRALSRGIRVCMCRCTRTRCPHTPVRQMFVCVVPPGTSTPLAHAQTHAHANVNHRHPTGAHTPPTVTHSATNRRALIAALPGAVRASASACTLERHASCGEAPECAHQVPTHATRPATVTKLLKSRGAGSAPGRRARRPGGLHRVLGPVRDPSQHNQQLSSTAR